MAQQPDRMKVLDSVPPILRLAIRKLPNLKYSGTRAVEVFEGAERTRHIEYVLRDGPGMRTWFPKGSPYEGQVIVESGGKRKHYFPGRNEIEVGPAKREEAFGRLLAMLRSRSLQFSTEPGGNVAGQSTVLVTLRDGGNVMQKLWIDREGMILRRDLFDLVGARVGYYEFTDIDYSPNVRAGDFEPARTGAKVVTQYDQVRRIASDGGFSPVFIPESESGYVLENTRVLRGAKTPVMHQTYMRQGGGVSLFQAKGLVELPMMRRAAKGLNVVSWSMGGNTFALIGNAGDDELRRVARLLGMR